MLNIIKSDLFRVVKGKGIYIAIFMMIFMITMSIIGMSPGYIGISSNIVETSNESTKTEEMEERIYNAKTLKEERQIIKEYGGFELDKQIIGANCNLYYIFIVIVFVVICVDLSDSTAKNTLSSAISRKKYYLSKLVTSLLLGTIIILLNNYCMYFLNIIINGKEFSSNFMEFTKLTVIQFPILYGIISILVCISFTSKKKSLYNGISIPLLMIVQLILLGMISLLKIDPSIMEFEVQNILSNIVINQESKYIIRAFIMGTIYTLGFNIIGYYLFKKTEIK